MSFTTPNRTVGARSIASAGRSGNLAADDARRRMIPASPTHGHLRANRRNGFLADGRWAAARLGFAAYVAPFVFVYQPALIFDGSPGEIAAAAAKAAVAMPAGGMAGYLAARDSRAGGGASAPPRP